MVRVLTFADDTTLVVHNHQDVQEILFCFLKARKAFGLKINLNKTEVMYHPH